MTPSPTPSDSPSSNSAPTPLLSSGDIVSTPFETFLASFWEKNRSTIYLVLVAAFVAIIARGGWEYIAAQRSAGLGREFTACTTPDSLKAFAEAHPDQSLGAVAGLEAADAAYDAGHMEEAADGYRKAAEALPAPFSSRARLGRALAEAQSGQRSEGEDLLRQISIDTTQLKSIRAQATYQLASLAADEGHADDVQRLTDSLMQLDRESPWTQRAFGLRARLPATAPAAAQPQASSAATGAPAISLPAAH